MRVCVESGDEFAYYETFEYALLRNTVTVIAVPNL